MTMKKKLVDKIIGENRMDLIDYLYFLALDI